MLSKELIEYLKIDKKISCTKANIEEKETKKPPAYTEAKLLSVMESAGKLIEDDVLKEAIKEHGLGTPATRAAIIETLINVKYIFYIYRKMQVKI